MAVAAKDALLEAPRAPDIILQKLQIVIRFQHDDVRPADAFDDQLRGMAQVCEKTDGTYASVQNEAHGVLGVMRNGKGVDADFTQFKGRTGHKHAAIELRLELAFDGFAGIAIAIDRDVQLGSDRAETLDVVRMLVGDEDASEVFRGAANRGEALADLAATEARVNEQTRFAGFQIGTIATGTAA